MMPKTTRTRAPNRYFGRTLATVAAMAALGVGACGDDPFAIRWELNPDTAVLYSLARPELNLVSGFNFQNRRPIRVEAAQATGNWDAALDTRDGQLVLLPPGALGVDSRAGIADLGVVPFDDVDEAPEDTLAYSKVEPVPMRMGNIYVVRTNEGIGSFGTRCVYYSKLEPLEIDVAGGVLRFVYDGNPVCNDRSFIPPD